MLGSFAAAQGVDLPTLIREALALAPIELPGAPPRHPKTGRASSGEACEPGRRTRDRALATR
ncbi:MAG TPA: hypothetical protein VL988_03095 [Solirubrobacteraceae bacterium]|nr:hypothetical protein [Solirubrobacteraceae bacterium]